MLRPAVPTLLAFAVVAACSKAPERGAAAGVSPRAVAVPGQTGLFAEPLPARAAADGPRFLKVDPQRSGLRFQNELRRENVVAYVYTGAGLAVGDYDGDGWPDVYLVSQDGPNKLFRQTAPLVFEDVTAKAGGLDGGDAWGNAASFADVDGDSDLDLYVCNLESPNLLYVNQGDGTFVEKAGPFGLGLTAASTGCAFADYDNDGDLDLYVLTNRVLKHLLPEEIVAEVTLPKAMRKTKAELLPPYPTFEKDARGDLVVPKGYEDHFFTLPDSPAPFQAGQCDRLFRNDGYARWVDVTKDAGIHDQGNGLSVVWWDFDGDGHQDLYVANDFQSPDQLYRNLGDGRFADVTKERLPHTAFFGMGCDFGDLDHDGRFDLLVADMSSTQHYWGKMLMGSMDQHRWFLMHAQPQQYMRNALYVNTGTGRFLEAAHLAGLASTDWTWAVRFADLDDDGWLDFFATNGIPVFTDNPDTGERFAKLWREGSHQQALELFRAIPSVAEKNVARRNDGVAFGGLHFTDAGAAWGLDESSVAHGAVVADLDRDGDLDVLTNNLNAPCSLFENRGSDGHRVLVELRGEKGNRQGIGAVVTVTAGGAVQTAQVSLTRGYMSAGDAVVHFGLGAATTIDALVVRWPSGAMQRFEKLAADQRYTVAEGPPPQPFPGIVDDFGDDDLNRHWFVSSSDGVRHVEREFDDYAVQPLLPHRLSRLGPGAAIGDVDGDGRDEYWIGGAAGQSGSLMRIGGKEDEAIPGPWRDDAECEDLGACFLDFDRDGDLDLYVASGGVEAGERTELLRDRLYVNDSKGAFTRAPDGVLPDLRDSSSCVSAADFDRDGDLDLFVGTRVVPGRFPQSGPSRLLRNDGGRFVDVAAELAPGLRDAGMVTSAVWTDVDADGFVDLVVAASWQPVRVFGNERGERLVDRTQALGLAELRGQWNGLAAGDLDGDGDVDLVATNLGLNTKYKASPQKPLRLYARDFDGNGTFDVVESKTATEGELPVRGLSCSSQAMPFVRERFPTYDQFARARLGDIYGQALGDSLVLECNELRHVVLEQRDGRFHAAPLPWLAQVSTAFGVAITDADADGVQDLVLVHNFFSPEPETGRSDGGLGLWMRGVGGLRFEPVAGEESGLLAAGDAKALALFELGGGVATLLITRSDDSALLLYSIRGSHSFPPVDRFLTVRLRGPAGNPTGVGARIELRQNGKVLARGEVQAGGSYLAQSSPSVAFAKVPADAVVRVLWPDGSSSETKVAKPSGPMEVVR